MVFISFPTWTYVNTPSKPYSLSIRQIIRNRLNNRGCVKIGIFSHARATQWDTQSTPTASDSSLFRWFYTRWFYLSLTSSSSSKQQSIHTQPRGRTSLDKVWRKCLVYWPPSWLPAKCWQDTYWGSTNPSNTPQQRVNSSPISTTKPMVRPREKQVRAASLYIINPGTWNFSKSNSANLHQRVQLNLLFATRVLYDWGLHEQNGIIL